MPRSTNSTPGCRILVYGVTGSGKSTAAQRIAARTGLPLTLADELTWAPGWVPVAEDEQRRRFEAVVAQDRWVLDTAYGAWLDVVLPRVDLVVGLDYPRWFSLQRVFRRSVMRAIDKKPICNGNTESFRAMFGRDSIIGWHFRSFSRKRTRMRAWAAAAEGPAVLLFTRSRDLEVWIDTLGDRSANGTTATGAEDAVRRPVNGSLSGTRHRCCQTGLMAETHIVSTSAGPVEIVQVSGERPPALFFPGGHCSAHCDCGWSLYTESGHAVISFSRPGYGRTRVGSLSAAEFAPLVREVCEQRDISAIAAAVGVSFGGLQAVHVAKDQQLGVPRLVLHSCAPSGLPYPDTRAEAIVGPVLFSPLLQGLVWRLVRRVVRADSGLRTMMARLSKLPVQDWWEQLSAADRDQARALFLSMRSDSGFVNDLRQGQRRWATARRDVLSNLQCPTLVTGSPHDRGVSFAHAEDFASAIPDADLVELDSPSHIFWVGPGRARLVSIVRSFIDG